MTTSLRVGYGLWANDARVNDLIALLSKHPEIKEVAFFTMFTHSILPLGEVQARAKKLKEIMPRFRAIGLSAGINHLSTLGHIDENLQHTVHEPWQRLIDQNGLVFQGGYCFRDENMRQHARQSYLALAAAEPEFIWIDDDIRLEYHVPLGFCCFCPLCLESFSAKTQTPWTRETLAAAFSEGEQEARLKLRASWIDTNRDYVTDIVRFIRQSVDETHPQMPLGFMTTHLVYSGNGYGECALALLNDNAVAEAKMRPGGGFYGDDTPIALLSKIHGVGRQNAYVPQSISDIQYEHENFPYQPLKKSCTIFVAEIAAAIGAGCTGAALNLMGLAPDPIDEFKPFFERVQQCTPFFERAVETFGRSTPEGITALFSKNDMSAKNVDGDWFQSNLWHMPGDEYSQIGIPFGYATETAKIHLLEGDSCLAIPRAELMQILSSGAILDGGALARLNQMGLGEFTGFSIRGEKESDAVEVLSDDAINAEYSGWRRDARPSFFRQKTQIIEPSEKARVLSNIVDFGEVDFGATSGVFENSLGGRIAVFGYFPWTSVSSLAKSSQMKNLMRWLSRDSIPAYISSFSKAALWCRRDAQNQLAIMLLNVSIDAQKLTIRVHQNESCRAVKLLQMNGKETIIQTSSCDENYDIFQLPEIAGWHAALITKHA